jgi:hypothetical protein
MVKPRALGCGGGSGRREAAASTPAICALHNELSSEMVRCNKTSHAGLRRRQAAYYQSVKQYQFGAGSVAPDSLLVSKQELGGRQRRKGGCALTSP